MLIGSNTTHHLACLFMKDQMIPHLHKLQWTVGLRKIHVRVCHATRAAVAQPHPAATACHACVAFLHTSAQTCCQLWSVGWDADFSEISRRTQWDKYESIDMAMCGCTEQAERPTLPESADARITLDDLAWARVGIARPGQVLNIKIFNEIA